MPRPAMLARPAYRPRSHASALELSALGRAMFAAPGRHACRAHRAVPSRGRPALSHTPAVLPCSRVSALELVRPPPPLCSSTAGFASCPAGAARAGGRTRQAQRRTSYELAWLQLVLAMVNVHPSASYPAC